MPAACRSSLRRQRIRRPHRVAAFPIRVPSRDSRSHPLRCTRAITTAALDTVFGHHGSLDDPASKLQLKGARWYSPDLGRFVSEDPIQDGSNWYMPYGNDPVNKSDPTGLSQAGHPLAGGYSVGTPAASAIPAVGIPHAGMTAPVIGGPSITSSLGPRPSLSTSAPTGYSTLAGPQIGGPSIVSTLGSGLNLGIRPFQVSTPQPSRATSSNSWLAASLDASFQGGWGDALFSNFGTYTTAQPYQPGAAPNYLTPQTAMEAEMDLARMRGAELTGVRPIGSDRPYGDVLRDIVRVDDLIHTSTDPLEAFFLQISKPFVQWPGNLLATAVDAVAPVGPPNHRLSFSDGSSVTVMSRGPSGGQLFNQALVVAPWLPQGAPAAGTGSSVATSSTVTS